MDGPRRAGRARWALSGQIVGPARCASPSLLAATPDSSTDPGPSLLQADGHDAQPPCWLDPEDGGAYKARCTVTDRAAARTGITVGAASLSPPGQRGVVVAVCSAGGTGAPTSRDAFGHKPCPCAQTSGKSGRIWRHQRSSCNRLVRRTPCKSRLFVWGRRGARAHSLQAGGRRVPGGAAAPVAPRPGAPTTSRGLGPGGATSQPARSPITSATSSGSPRARGISLIVSRTIEPNSPPSRRRPRPRRGTNPCRRRGRGTGQRCGVGCW
jgi:hypothetical protein